MVSFVLLVAAVTRSTFGSRSTSWVRTAGAERFRLYAARAPRDAYDASRVKQCRSCLAYGHISPVRLYTSDAADELTSAKTRWLRYISLNNVLKY